MVTGGLELARKNELRALGLLSEKALRDFFGRPAWDYAAAESESAYLLRHRLFLEGEESAMRGPPPPTLAEDDG